MAGLADELNELGWKAEAEGDKQLGAALMFLSVIKGAGRADLMEEAARYLQGKAGVASDEQELEVDEESVAAAGGQDGHRDSA